MIDGGKRKRGICKLCLKEKSLCRSHIIPEFFYKPLSQEEEKGRFFSFQENSDFIGVHQKGLWLNLFCDNCEDILQKNEDYVARLFDRGLWEIAKPLKVTDGKVFEEGKKLTDIDYSRFKLLFLSVFWRLSLDTRFFQAIQFGPYQDKLRMIILNSSVPGETEFGVMITKVTIQGKYNPDLIAGILIDRWENKYHRYGVILQGYLISLIVGKPPIDNETLVCVTRESGCQIIGLLEFEKLEVLHGMAKQIANAKLPI